MGTLLGWARERLRVAGADSPALTAFVLLEHAAGVGREQALAHPEQLALTDAAAQFCSLVDRRAAGEPLAYIVGAREFFGRRFRVTPATLVPRPETEHLVDLALARMDASAQRQRGGGGEEAPWLLDVGTGSGILAITLLAERPGWLGLATDIDPEALAVARSNAGAHGVLDRVRFVACHLADAGDATFPLIVANLPYIPSADIEHLPLEISHYEPRRALDGGVDGTDILRECIDSLPRLLRPGGVALFEIGQGQAVRLQARARSAVRDAAVTAATDLAGIKRFLIIDRG